MIIHVQAIAYVVICKFQFNATYASKYFIPQVPMRADTFFPLTTPYLGECLIPSVVGASESVHLNTSTGRSNKAYICPYCNKCFGHKNDWRKHVAVHTGHRPHKCSYCDQSFIQKGSLKSHLFRVHNTMLEKKS